MEKRKLYLYPHMPSPAGTYDFQTLSSDISRRMLGFDRAEFLLPDERLQAQVLEAILTDCIEKLCDGRCQQELMKRLMEDCDEDNGQE